MAISLQEVNVRKNKNEKKRDKQREKTVRPWQSFNPFESGVRTLKAQEAVRKAKEIVEKNNTQVSDSHTISKNFVRSFFTRADSKKDEEITETLHYLEENKSCGLVHFIKYLFQ